MHAYKKRHINHSMLILTQRVIFVSQLIKYVKTVQVNLHVKK